jgi:CRISPR/Cas system type I-B associated protein Csh2 (Cas7 group RAMP superfamily)
MTDIPRNRYLGKRVGELPADEDEHFIRCAACNGWIDCRDLGAVFDHEGPLPHPPGDQPQ